jgi:adenylate cyclase
MNVRRWFHAGQGLALALLMGLAFLRIADPPLVESLRHKVFDAYQAASPRIWQPLPIAVIDIDERSLTQYGQWPWPRTVLAELVAKLSAAGTVAVAFDIVFAEPDRLSPQALAQSIHALPEAARVELSTLPDNDQVFGNAIRRSRVVLGQTGVNAETPRPPGLPVATIGGDPTRFLIQFPGLLLNQPALEDAASGRGLFSILPDPDGIVRRVPLAASAAGSIRSSLSVELLRVATGQDAFAIRSDEAGVSSIVVAGVQVPTDRNAHLWIAYTPHEPRRFVSAADVLAGTLPPGRLQNHLAVVGTSAVGLLDIRATPLNRTVPGVEIHVQALENMLTRSWLTRPHYALGAELVAMLVISLLIILLAPRLGALPIAGLGALTAVGLVGASWWLYQSHRTLIDVVYPLGTAFATFLVIAFDNFRREELQRRQVRSAFSRYLAPSVVEALARHPEQLRLGARRGNSPSSSAMCAGSPPCRRATATIRKR